MFVLDYDDLQMKKVGNWIPQKKTVTRGPRKWAIQKLEHLSPECDSNSYSNFGYA